MLLVGARLAVAKGSRFVRILLSRGGLRAHRKVRAIDLRAVNWRRDSTRDCSSGDGGDFRARRRTCF